MEYVSKFLAIWSILRPFSKFCGHFVYFAVIRYIFPRFGMVIRYIFSGLVCCTKKNLATLRCSHDESEANDFVQFIVH
jgi:hypothetical protein